MRPIIFNLCILICALFTISCSSDNDAATPAIGDVEIYLIESFETETGYNKIIESSVVCQEEPLFRYNQLLSYNSSNYTFSLSEDAKELFSMDNQSLHFAPFAVKANNELIYTAYFWPEYSSQIVVWATASPLLAETYGIIKVELGYPTSIVEEPIPDRRNDTKILDIFERDGKLK